MVKFYTAEIHKLKKDILTGTNTCNSKYDNIKKDIRKNMFPQFDYESTTNRVINNIYKRNVNTINNIPVYNYSSNVTDYINNKYTSHSSNIKFADSLKDRMLKSRFNKLEQLKKDILSNSKLHNQEDICIKKMIANAYQGENLYNILDDDPLIMLGSLIKISIDIEKKGEKTINCFPLRTNIIPKYIKLDTTTLIHLLFPEDKNKGYYLTSGNTKKLQDEIWKTFFITNKKVFKDKKYQFNNQIATDGVGCSILFIRKDLYNPLKVVKIKSMSKPYNFRNERYVDELTDLEKEKYKNYNDVGIDPGKSDLISSTNGDTKIVNRTPGPNGEIRQKHVTTTFRYTQNSRRKETKSKQYSKSVDENKKQTMIFPPKYLDNSVKNEKMSIKELESLLSTVNSKSCIYENVKKYIKLKNIINANIQEYYEGPLHRKLKWYSYINIQKNEAKMINEFKKIYGPPEKAVIFMGDYGGGNLRNCEPTKGKGLRKTFKRAGYSLFLVDEYNTSKKSFVNGLDNTNFRKRRNPRPYRQDTCLVHGLLRVTTVQSNNSSSKHVLTDRDFNGSMNILIRARCILNNVPIPAHLLR